MAVTLVTGLLNLDVSVNNTSCQDVFKNKDKKFEDFFSKNLEKEKGIQNKKENIEKVKDDTKKDVKNEGKVEETEDNKEEIKEIKEKKGTKDKEKVKKTKEEENEMTDKINGLVEKILDKINNVEVEELKDSDVSLKDVKEFMEVNILEEVKTLELTEEETLKLQEVLEKKLSQNVVEVGPQNVETEKITFNKYDDLEGKLEALRERLENKSSKVENEDIKSDSIEPELSLEELGSDFVSLSYEEEGSLENKGEKSKDEKVTIKDFTQKKVFNNKVEQLDVKPGEMNNKILDVKVEDISSAIVNKTVDMQEQIDVIKQISEKIDVNLFEDKSEMIIKLKPDHLGKVTVEIAVENGNVTAKFLAESEKVKEILESNMQNLKDHLAKQGMVVQDLSVSVGNDKRGLLFEQHDYSSLKKRQRIEEVNNNESYFVEDEYGLNELKEAYYWPDSTVSFSA